VREVDLLANDPSMTYRVGKHVDDVTKYTIQILTEGVRIPVVCFSSRHPPRKGTLMQQVLDHYRAFSQFTYPGLYQEQLLNDLPADVGQAGRLVNR